MDNGQNQRPNKKVKIESIENSSSQCYDHGDSDSSQAKLNHLKALLHDKYYRDIPLTDVYVDTITDVKCIGRLLNVLKTSYPIPSLLHLKRVRGNRVILMKADDDTVSSADECLNRIKTVLTTVNDDDNALLFGGLSLNPVRIAVPAEVPLTRAQFNRASVYWSCLFREDKTVERLLSGEFFDRRQLDVIAANMRTAIRMARTNSSPVGALVCDPTAGNNGVLAVCYDQRLKNPMKHAAMVLIDLIAAAQGGGCWPESKKLTNNSEDVNAVPLKSVSTSQLGIVNNSETSPYLLTGYDVYLTREPCVMCAMALTHSRVRTVFYGCRVNASGGLGSLCKIHAVPELNHRYTVFPDVLADDCSSLLQFEKSD